MELEALPPLYCRAGLLPDGLRQELVGVGVELSGTKDDGLVEYALFTGLSAQRSQAGFIRRDN